MTFGKRLKSLRIKKGLSISECAKALSVSPSTYREWEYGRSIIGEPYPKMAELFEVSLSDLFGYPRSEVQQHFLLLEKELQDLSNFARNIRLHL